jgi:hypothetical protein
MAKMNPCAVRLFPSEAKMIATMVPMPIPTAANTTISNMAPNDFPIDERDQITLLKRLHNGPAYPVIVTVVLFMSCAHDGNTR